MATKKKTDCRQYRIGDFARYLGVTAEFLKHYQESGLLDVCLLYTSPSPRD